MKRPTKQPSPLAPTCLLTVGAEGGALDVLGRLVDGAWHYRVVLDQRTFASFDPSLEGMPLYEASEWTEDWEVVAKLDALHCWNLYGVTVHPAIADRIEQALAARRGPARARAAAVRSRKPVPKAADANLRPTSSSFR